MKSRRPLALSALAPSVLVLVIGCQDQKLATEPVQDACSGVPRCTSVKVANVNPDGSGVQVLKVDGGVGAIAGARFPDNWLPVGGPQNVVVTITEVTSAETDAVSRTRKTPCHAGLPFQQFNKCFNFTTTPALAAINENGDEFALGVTVAMCYRLQGTGDPREKFAEMYASGPNEPAHTLADVGDDGILGVGARDCTTIEPSGLGSSNPLTRYASMGWRKFREGLGQLFGVKTAYAVDVGLGGIVKKFSNIGPALTAEIQAYPTAATVLTLQSGTATARARIVGNHAHLVGGQPTINGIDSVPVTFIVTAGNGTLRALNSVASVDSLTVNTSKFAIPQSGAVDSGVASVIWTPPTAPGAYTLTARGPATGGPVTFTATVEPPPVTRRFDNLCLDTAAVFVSVGVCGSIVFQTVNPIAGGTDVTVWMRSEQGSLAWNDATTSSAVNGVTVGALNWGSVVGGVSAVVEGSVAFFGTRDLSTVFTIQPNGPGFEITNRLPSLAMKGGAVGCSAGPVASQYQVPYLLVQHCEPQNLHGSIRLDFRTSGVWNANQLAYLQIHFQWIEPNVRAGASSCFAPDFSSGLGTCIVGPRP